MVRPAKVSKHTENHEATEGACDSISLMRDRKLIEGNFQNFIFYAEIVHCHGFIPRAIVLNLYTPFHSENDRYHETMHRYNSVNNLFSFKCSHSNI